MFVPSRPAPFFLSLLAHGLILAWVASGPVRDEPQSVYRQEIAPHASRLVWYHFREKLPDVSPTDAPPAARPPRIELKLPSQEVVAGSAKSLRARQFIWQPAPKIELKQELQSPNVLALRAPRVEPPPKPKLFVPPPEVPRPAVVASALAAPPQLQAASVLAQSPLRPSLAAPARPRPKAFVVPDETKKTPVAPSLIAAPPEVRAARALNGAIVNVLGAPPARPQPRAFVPPSGRAAGKGTKPSAFGPLVADVPALPASALNSGVSVAIVGLNPSATPVPPPEGSRDARLSAGPESRASGGDEGAGQGGMLFVPGLTIRNGTRDIRPALVARAAPTSAENLRAAVRERVPDPLPGGAHPLAARVASSPDPMLDGRAIYGMTVQMPNITSYAGSWMIWFADREHPFGQGAAVVAPVPLRKVDPKYIASAVEDRIEGKVRLAAVIRKDGSVDSVKLLRRLDDRLDQSASEAMHKWQFEPALSNGKPVEVDAVIEIPFRLAPKVAR